MGQEMRAAVPMKSWESRATLLLPAPCLELPSSPGASARLRHLETVISGKGEPGATVLLFRDGTPAGETGVLDADETEDFSFESAVDLASVSRMGKSWLIHPRGLYG